MKKSFAFGICAVAALALTTAGCSRNSGNGACCDKDGAACCKSGEKSDCCKEGARKMDNRDQSSY